MGIVRTGEVSKVNYKKGLVQVMYADLDNKVTDEMPCLSRGETTLPSVGDTVAVVHMDNGIEDGICLGKIFTETQTPTYQEKGEFYKELGKGASISTQDGKITFTDTSGSITLEEIIERRG